MQNEQCQIVGRIGLSAHAKFHAVNSSLRVPVALETVSALVCTALGLSPNAK